ncbi:MAG: choice-of-anchor M domain-containing protein [Actinomycetaceae bacterium]|nr:choice-of-anchor M domain-containing protein [Actinomycetaceae bacterium]
MRFKKYVSAALGMSACLCLALCGMSALADDLTQHVDANENRAPKGEQVIFDSGHADMGPVIGNGLELLIRDDSKEKPVWREVEDIVFQVGEKAAISLPDNNNYSFTGAKSGERVWAIPQTEVGGVPWLGWNTQSPSLMNAVKEGVSFEFIGHQGPGTFTVFEQPGGVAKPEVLWTSEKPASQSAWVELNTHTHANWVFTKPGVHLVGMRVRAKMADGTEKQVEGHLRFFVGTGDPGSAFAAEWKQGAPAQSAPAKATTAPESQSHASNLIGYITLALGALVLIAAIVIAVTLKRRRDTLESA